MAVRDINPSSSVVAYISPEEGWGKNSYDKNSTLQKYHFNFTQVSSLHIFSHRRKMREFISNLSPWFIRKKNSHCIIDRLMSKQFFISFFHNLIRKNNRNIVFSFSTHSTYFVVCTTLSSSIFKHRSLYCSYTPNTVKIKTRKKIRATILRLHDLIFNSYRRWEVKQYNPFEQCSRKNWKLSVFLFRFFRNEMRFPNWTGKHERNPSFPPPRTHFLNFAIQTKQIDLFPFIIPHNPTHIFPPPLQ